MDEITPPTLEEQLKSITDLDQLRDMILRIAKQKKEFAIRLQQTRVELTQTDQESKITIAKFGELVKKNELLQLLINEQKEIIDQLRNVITANLTKTT